MSDRCRTARNAQPLRRTESPDTMPRLRDAKWPDWSITLGFVALFVIQLAHHEMWRDETHVWAQAAGNRRLPELWHLLHYEGHPGLWHLLVWLVTKMTAEVFAMQALHAAIAIAIIVLIGIVAPFTRLERALLLLNYFIVFEYTVMSRNYGIALLLALLYTLARLRAPQRAWLNMALLGLLANTNVYAAIFSAVLALEYAWERRGEGPRAILAPALLYASLLAFAARTLWPAADLGFSQNPPLHGIAAWAAALLDELAHYVAVPFLPFDAEFPARFSEAGKPQDMRLLAVAAPALILALYCVFRRDRRLLFILGATALGAIGFGTAVYEGSVRHWGIVFVAFLVALWMQRARTPRRSIIVLALLAIGALGGLAAEAGQWMRPFSNTRLAASWLTAHGLQDEALIGFPDYTVEAVSVYLRRPIWFLNCECRATYLIWNRQRSGLEPPGIVAQRLVHAAQQPGAERAILLAGRALGDDERAALAAAGLRATELAHFTGAERPFEDLILYRLGPANAATRFPAALEIESVRVWRHAPRG
jgi:hypothetical protein